MERLGAAYLRGWPALQLLLCVVAQFWVGDGVARGALLRARLPPAPVMPAGAAQ